MDIHRLKRDPVRVRAALRNAGDETIVTPKGCKIVIPERYVDKGLAEISSDVRILGIFAIIVDDEYYAVSNAITMVRLKSSTISTVKIDGDNHLEFKFDPGSVVIADTQVVVNDQLLFKVFDEFIAKGKVPWFMDYRNDLTALFDSAKRYAGRDFGHNHVILEIIAAAITRMEKDLNVYYRYGLKSPADLVKVAPVTIPLRSVSHGATNTPTKLIGSYFGDGLTSALVTPSDRIEKIEEILRM